MLIFGYGFVKFFDVIYLVPASRYIAGASPRSNINGNQFYNINLNKL